MGVPLGAEADHRHFPAREMRQIRIRIIEHFRQRFSPYDRLLGKG
jgi:hypothetical protein